MNDVNLQSGVGIYRCHKVDLKKNVGGKTRGKTKSGQGESGSSCFVCLISWAVDCSTV